MTDLTHPLPRPRPRRSPLVASASPLTGRLDTLRRLAAAGAGRGRAAVALRRGDHRRRSREQPAAPSTRATEAFAEAADLPARSRRRRGTASIGTSALVRGREGSARRPGDREPQRHLAAADGSGTPRALVDAGADALELNVYLVAADVARHGRDRSKTGSSRPRRGGARRSRPCRSRSSSSPFFTAIAQSSRQSAGRRGRRRARAASTASTSPTSISRRSPSRPTHRPLAPRPICASRCAGSRCSPGGCRCSLALSGGVHTADRRGEGAPRRRRRRDDDLVVVAPRPRAPRRAARRVDDLARGPRVRVGRADARQRERPLGSRSRRVRARQLRRGPAPPR